MSYSYILFLLLLLSHLKSQATKVLGTPDFYQMSIVNPGPNVKYEKWSLGLHCEVIGGSFEVLSETNLTS